MTSYKYMYVINADANFEIVTKKCLNWNRY